MIQEQKITNNKKYQAKLSYHRRCTVEIRRDIASFISDNFDIELPNFKADFMRQVDSCIEPYTIIWNDFPNLIKAYYNLANYGESFGSLYQNEKGHYETYTVAHIFSKHRLDPVWNYRKSNLIRNIYRQYLAETKIYENYHPVHLTLTVPHAGGTWKNKRFYVKELLEQFREVRRSPKWKNFVHAGEYGIEVKTSPNKNNGLHIHIHSLVFLKSKNLNEFRKWITEKWQKLTGGNQIWCETIFFYQKGENGRYITELKTSKELETFENDDLTCTSDLKKEFIEVKKKIYVDEFRRETNKRSDLSQNEKDKLILDAFLYGILECIKYHFKNDSLKDQYGYDFQLVEEVLSNTKGKRLYSRFGAFYNEKQLSFNHLQDDDDEVMAESQNESLNPFTGESSTTENTQIVMFYPEQQKRASKTAVEPYKLLNYKTDIYKDVGFGKPIKEILKEYIKNKFPNKNKNKKLC